MTDWQPEGTAPLDIPVLIWNGTHIAVAEKHQWRDNRATWSIAESFGFNEDGEIFDVSHWMTLPAPPGGTE